jgi:hypothetical protein
MSAKSQISLWLKIRALLPRRRAYFYPQERQEFLARLPRPNAPERFATWRR